MRENETMFRNLLNMNEIRFPCAVNGLYRSGFLVYSILECTEIDGIFFVSLAKCRNGLARPWIRL